jgi:hypothetical protein
MTTDRQRTANRANSRKSTGPRTGAGKALVRMNPLRHGLTTAAVVVPGIESPAEWERFRAEVVASLNPIGSLQEQLAGRAAGLLWRLRRVERFEALSIAAGQAELQVPDRPKSDRDLLEEFGRGDQDAMTDEEFLADREASIAEVAELGAAYSDDTEMTAEELAEWQADAQALRQRITLSKAIKVARRTGVSDETADRVIRYEGHLSRQLSQVLDQLDRLRGDVRKLPKMSDSPAA